jgi:transcriptional regulator with XRE-family HTH domain
VGAGRLIAMDDAHVGGVIRSVRLRRGWRQEDLAAAARVSRASVSRAERGHLDTVWLPNLRAIGAALEIRLDFTPWWRGGQLDRIVHAGHGALHEQVARVLGELPGWTSAAEVTFSIFGERGSIDLLAWNADRRALLVVELKTEIPDPAALIAQVDRYVRLARPVAAERGWNPATVSRWVAVAESDMNRRQVSRHRAMLRNAFPANGHGMRHWLRDPAEPVAALSFLADVRGASTNGRFAPTRRVRPPKRPAGGSGERLKPSRGHDNERVVNVSEGVRPDDGETTDRSQPGVR